MTVFNDPRFFPLLPLSPPPCAPILPHSAPLQDSRFQQRFRSMIAIASHGSHCTWELAKGLPCPDRHGHNQVYVLNCMDRCWVDTHRKRNIGGGGRGRGSTQSLTQLHTGCSAPSERVKLPPHVRPSFPHDLPQPTPSKRGLEHLERKRKRLKIKPSSPLPLGAAPKRE